MFETLLPIFSALAAATVALYVLTRPRDRVVRGLLAAGLLVLAADQAAVAALRLAETGESLLFRLRAHSLIAALIPGVWLLFSFAYGHSSPREALARRRWLLAAAFALPLGWAGLASQAFTAGEPVFLPHAGFQAALDWPGKAFMAICLLADTLILSNLERALRASAGRKRWQVKFLVLGGSAIFGGRIYAASYALLFSVLDSGILMVPGTLLILGCGLIAVALRRAETLKPGLYLSHGLIYRSITILAVGLYLVLVAVAVRLIDYLEWTRRLRLDVVLVFAALITIIAVLLSDRLRLGTRSFISRHLKRPFYDYRRIWLDFIQRTASVVEPRELCRVSVRMVSETLELLSVSIWLRNDSETAPRLADSTALARQGAEGLADREEAWKTLFQGLEGDSKPIDLQASRAPWATRLRERHGDFLDQAFLRYCAPLRAQGRTLGLLGGANRVGGSEFTREDFELFRALADQTAAALLNLQLSDRLRQAKEMEVFQNMSAFFVHDLKNLASRLSLTAENLPKHFDKPDFRQDAIRVMERSVGKIEAFCTRLSTLQARGAERAEVDLRDVLEEVVGELEESLPVAIDADFPPMPPVMADGEQMHSVFTNLVVNAAQASPEGGRVELAARNLNGTIEVAVRDHGVGMSPEFMEKRLFRPFQTTKKEGMGIGLYQSKLIVEAHRGRIDVESQPGKGTVFRVRLPAGDS